MRKLNKVILLVLILIFCLSTLTGCNLFWPKNAMELIEKSNEVAAGISSYNMDVKLDATVCADLKVEGSTIKLDLPIAAKLNFDVSEEYIHGDFVADAQIDMIMDYDSEEEAVKKSVGTNVDLYAITGDDIIVYANTDNERWCVADTEVQDTIKSFTYIVDGSKDVSLFENAEVEKVSGGYVVTVGLIDIISDEDLSDMFNMAFGENEDVDLDNIKELIGDEKVSLTFNKECYMTGFSTDIELNATTLLTEDIVAEAGLDGTSANNVSMKISIAAEIGGFNTINKDDIKVPDEIVKEAETGVGDNMENQSNEDVVTSQTGLSNNLMDLQITIDGVVYTLPCDYDPFVENGWCLDLESEEHKDGYVLDPGRSTDFSLSLRNDKYGDDYHDFHIDVYFENLGDFAADVTECTVCNIVLDTFLASKVPNVQLANGITWGSTKEEVVEAYGECEDIYEVDDGLYYTYRTEDWSREVELYIDDESGLAMIELWYSNYFANSAQ